MIGIMAKVRVSLTMVADSSIGLVETIPGASCGGYRGSMLTAVPAKRAKPSLDR